MTHFKNYLNLMVMAVFVLGIYSCDEEESKDEELAFNIKVMATSEFGNVLVNQKEQAIYFFASDMGDESACTGGCADAWPPVIGEVADLDLASNLNEDYFGTITREDGQVQLTYKGWPLYYFAPEGEREAAGVISGDAKNNVFFVAKPDYSVMLGKQAVEEGAEAVTYLVDSWGKTLYDLTTDEDNVSTCSGGCADAWPIFSMPETLVIPSSLSADKFSTVEREDDLGAQLAWNGKALYYFASDEEIRGNVTGQGAGDKFFVVEPTL